MTAYIYRIRNLNNEKFYIGSTRQEKPRSRWTTGHLRDLRNQKHDNQRLQHSWNKHGEKAFVFEVIDEFEYQTERDIEVREQEWIDKLNPQYNIARKVIRNEDTIRKATETNSKEYFLRDPDGNEFIIKNLKEFCRKYNLNSSGMWQVAIGGQTHHKKWTCRYLHMADWSIESVRESHKHSLEEKKSRPPKPQKQRKLLRQYEIFDPDGKMYECDNLQKFSKQYGLDMGKVLSGEASNCKGWKVRIKGKDFAYHPRPRDSHRTSWFIKEVSTGNVQSIFNLGKFAKDNNLKLMRRGCKLRGENFLYYYSKYEDFRDVPPTYQIHSARQSRSSI